MTEYKTVPVEPTEEMIKAAARVFRVSDPDLKANIYKAMLEAAPSPWRPIEEAPRDGESVIVAKIGLTHDVSGCEVGDEEYKRIVFETDPTVRSVWWVSKASFSTLIGSDKPCWNDGFERLVTPTHFMPLPEPPTGESG